MERNVTLKWFDLGRCDVMTEAEILSQTRGIYMYLKAIQTIAGRLDIDRKNNPFLYIGSVCDGTIEDRLKYHRESNSPDEVKFRNCIQKNTRVPIIKVAKIELEANQRITKDPVNAIECCLIFQVKPVCNDKCKDKYTGCERTLVINNGGDYEPLKPEYTCSENSNSDASGNVT